MELKKLETVIKCAFDGVDHSPIQRELCVRTSVRIERRNLVVEVKVDETRALPIFACSVDFSLGDVITSVSTAFATILPWRF